MEKITIDEVLRATGGKLVAGDPGSVISGVSIDSRTVENGDLFVALKGERFDGHAYAAEAAKKGAGAVLVRNRVNVDVPVVKVNRDTLDAMQDLAKHYRKKYTPALVAITGSNGKTTTKDMLAAILSQRGKVTATKGNYNNLIGLPLTMFNIGPETGYCVLEMGANHLGEIKTLTKLSTPAIGVVTNIGNAHLGYFHSIKNVLKAKMELVDNLPPDGVAVINLDNYYLRQSIKRTKRRIVTFGIKEKAEVRAANIEVEPEKNRCSFNLYMNGKKERVELSTFAKNNIYNAIAACAAAGCLDYPAEMMAEALRSFRFPDRRFSLSEFNGIKIINDAYNANPTSVEMALEETGKAFKNNRKIAVLGDMLELGSKSKTFHEESGRSVYKNNFKALVTVGSASEDTASAAIEAGMREDSVFVCGTNEEVVGVLSRIIRKDDVIIIKGSRKMKLDEVVEKIGSVLKT